MLTKRISTIASCAESAIEALSHAKGFAEMDVFFINAPITLADLPHVVPLWAETYCLWKHTERTAIAFGEYQKLAKQLLGVPLAEIEELNHVLNFAYDYKTCRSITYECYHAFNRQGSTLSTRPYRKLEFIREEWISRGLYENDVPELIKSVLQEYIQLVEIHTKALSHINPDFIMYETSPKTIRTATKKRQEALKKIG